MQNPTQTSVAQQSRVLVRKQKCSLKLQAIKSIVLLSVLG